MRWLRAWHVWLILIAATLISWVVTESTSAARLGSTAVVLIAAFKINMVIAHFMELKWQPRPFRLVLSGWIGLVSLIIIGGMWAA
jgi:Prokaryotic Cytochrome C oxidase subunit IV